MDFKFLLPPIQKQDGTNWVKCACNRPAPHWEKAFWVMHLLRQPPKWRSLFQPEPQHLQNWPTYFLNTNQRSIKLSWFYSMLLSYKSDFRINHVPRIKSLGGWSRKRPRGCFGVLTLTPNMIAPQPNMLSPFYSRTLNPYPGWFQLCHVGSNQRLWG